MPAVPRQGNRISLTAKMISAASVSRSPVRGVIDRARHAPSGNSPPARARAGAVDAKDPELPQSGIKIGQQHHDNRESDVEQRGHHRNGGQRCTHPGRAFQRSAQGKCRKDRQIGVKVKGDPDADPTAGYGRFDRQTALAKAVYFA